jgi:carbon storage regulator
MLVLSRKIEEEIRIGDQVVVRILAIKDGQVKIGIEAPRSLRVFRGELYEQALRQNEAAARAERSAAAEAAARLAEFKIGGTTTESST